MAGSTRRYLVIQCQVLEENCRPLFEVGGEITDIFRRALDIEPEALAVARVCRGDVLPDPETVDAVLITGSGAMVADPLPWIISTAEWLRRARDLDIPTLGVCFGHQLLAHAFGGVVEQTADSIEFETVAVDRVGDGGGLLDFLPPRFAAQGAHFQVVTKAPDGAEIIASNEAGIQALRFGPRSWGVQFHPELSDEYLRLVVGNLRNAAERGVDVGESLRKIRPVGEVADLFRAFRDRSGLA